MDNEQLLRDGECQESGCIEPSGHSGSHSGKMSMNREQVEATWKRARAPHVIALYKDWLRQESNQQSADRLLAQAAFNAKQAQEGEAAGDIYRRLGELRGTINQARALLRKEAGDERTPDG